jgi:hypothetical protein
MAVVPAVILGASALGGAALSSSGGKKAGGDSGQALLSEIAAKLFGETEPLRAETINQALNALTTGESHSPLLQQTRSAISSEGSRQKESARGRLSRSGLANSSVGLASLEDIDRAVSQLLSNADVADLSRLTNIGTSIGFGQTPSTAVSAASTLANTQANERLQAIAGQTATGKALGDAIALLFQGKTNPSTGSNAPITSPVLYTGNYGLTTPENTGGYPV